MVCSFLYEKIKVAGGKNRGIEGKQGKLRGEIG
jgi:hypothetical protein